MNNELGLAGFLLNLLCTCVIETCSLIKRSLVFWVACSGVCFLSTLFSNSVNIPKLFVFRHRSRIFGILFIRIVVRAKRVVHHGGSLMLTRMNGDVSCGTIRKRSAFASKRLKLSISSRRRRTTASCHM